MANLSVNSVNLQLMQHYIRPKFAADDAPLLITADKHCYQMAVSTWAVYDSLETMHDEPCVHALWLRRAARGHWRVTKVSSVTGMTGKCFDYKELQSLLGVLASRICERVTHGETNDLI